MIKKNIYKNKNNFFSIYKIAPLSTQRSVNLVRGWECFVGLFILLVYGKKISKFAYFRKRFCTNTAQPGAHFPSIPFYLLCWLCEKLQWLRATLCSANCWLGPYCILSLKAVIYLSTPSHTFSALGRRFLQDFLYSEPQRLSGSQWRMRDSNPRHHHILAHEPLHFKFKWFNSIFFILDKKIWIVLVLFLKVKRRAVFIELSILFSCFLYFVSIDFNLNLTPKRSNYLHFYIPHSVFQSITRTRTL